MTATTWNPSDVSSVHVVLSNTNHTATITPVPNSPGADGVRGVDSKSSGKFYIEFNTLNISGNATGLGICKSTVSLVGGYSQVGAITIGKNGDITVNNVASGITLGSAINGTTVGMAWDATAQLVWFRESGGANTNWNNNAGADPATGTLGISTSSISGALFPVLFDNGFTAGIAATLNSGDSAFALAAPSGFGAWTVNAPPVTGTIATALGGMSQVANGQVATVGGTITTTLAGFKQVLLGGQLPTPGGTAYSSWWTLGP